MGNTEARVATALPAPVAYDTPDNTFNAKCARESPDVLLQHVLASGNGACEEQRAALPQCIGYFGRQCSANAVAAVCRAHVLNPNLWTSLNVDECLMAGNKLFELSYELLPSTYTNIVYLRPDELHSCVTFPENEIKFQVQINDEYYGTSMNNIATVDHGIVNYCIDDAVLCFLHNFNYGIFTCQLQCVAIMKISNDYFIFDSHKRGKDGLTDGQNGTAVLLRFNDINDLVLHLRSLFKCTTCSSTGTVQCATCQFTIIPLFISAVTNTQVKIPARHHLGENESGNVCSTCVNHLKKGKVPHFAAKNGLVFDPLPQELTGLTTLEERLVSARIPFMQIRELGYQKQLGLKGNCVNVPIDINKTVTCLPRMDSEDDTLLVQLMRRMSDKTPYAFENVRPEKQFHDETNNSATDLISTSNTDESTEQADEIDDLMDQQETLLTSGFVADSGVKIAPGEGNMPLSLTLDEDMDVLAFPTVYGGKQRIFKVKYTPVEMAKAEARHHDRRVATNIPKNESISGTNHSTVVALTMFSKTVIMVYKSPKTAWNVLKQQLQQAITKSLENHIYDITIVGDFNIKYQ
ncbi:putative HTH-type transcriptional regulator YuaB, partial [Frankliniella fusca]